MKGLKEQVLANIEKFPVGEFCPDGGWPKFDNLEVLLYKETPQEDASVILDIELVYDCEKAGCCFIPGGDNHTRLHKRIKLSEAFLEVLSEQK
jgi:hypothetical protein